MLRQWSCILAAAFLLAAPSWGADDGAGEQQNGAPVSPAASAAIAVTTGDSSPDDTLLEFGAVFPDRTRDLNVTVTNSGDADLVLGSLGLAGVLQAPFSEVSDGCSGKILAPAGRCSIRLRFSPIVFGNFQGSFDIASNDPARPTVPVTLRGMAGPDIVVTDAVLPEDDGLLPFGNVPFGMAKRKTVHVSNPGTGDLQIGLITAPTDARFTIVGSEENSRHCSERLLSPRQSCFIIVSFRPTEQTDFSGTVTIPSSDPETPAVTVNLTGTGGAPAADFPAPALIHPDPGQINLREDVTFRWANCRDAGGRDATYRFYCSKNVDFSESRMRFLGETTLRLAVFGLGGALLLAPGQRRRLRSARLMLLVLCLAACILSCSEDIEDSSTSTLSELEPNTTYNWKVIAEYDDGFENESEIRTFTTRP